MQINKVHNPFVINVVSPTKDHVAVYLHNIATAVSFVTTRDKYSAIRFESSLQADSFRKAVITNEPSFVLTIWNLELNMEVK